VTPIVSTRPSPAEIQHRAHILRQKARTLVKASQQLREAASVLRQETEDVFVAPDVPYSISSLTRASTVAVDVAGGSKSRPG
jgi:hypothetical protein